MEENKKVLLVTNSITDQELEQIHHAISDANQNQFPITLSLVHVIPNLPTCYFNIPSMVLLAEQYYEEAKNSLTTVANVLTIPKRDQWLVTGRIKTEVLRLAGKLRSNYILASSTCIPDLHQALAMNTEHLSVLVKNMNRIGV